VSGELRMISKLIEYSIKNRGVVLLISFLLCLWGWQSFRDLPIDAVPDITNVQVQVNTPVEALTPEEIERTVTLPIETVLGGVPGVTQVRSLSRFGISQVTAVFEDKTDIFRARQLVTERLQTAATQIPEGVHPKLGPVSSGLGEIFHYTVEAEKPLEGEDRILQLMELRALQDWYVKPRLLTVKGVAEVNTIGGYEKQIHIQPDPAKLARYGIHLGDIANTIKSVNRNVGGGYVEQTGEQLLLQGSGIFRSLDDIRNVPIRTLETMKSVAIGDVARVTLGKELRTGAAMLNGQEAVLGTVLMLLGENSRTVAHRVAQRVETIRKDLPPGYTLKTLYDRSKLVDSTLNTVLHNLTAGAILVLVVLVALIGNLRAAFIAAGVIPITLLLTFVGMRWFGLSGNLVSLGALDFGILIDGAVIVLDHCVRKIQERSTELKRALSRSEVSETVAEATIEIRKAAGFGELVIAVVFLPIFAFVGVEGKMFIPMAATFIIALVAALALSFTFVPALASLVLAGNGRDKEPWLMRIASSTYRPILEGALRYRVPVVGIAVAVTVFGGLLFRHLGGEFLPQLDEGSAAVQFIRPVSTSLTQSLALETKSHQLISSEFPEVETIFSRMGTSEIATDPMGVNISDSYVLLKPYDTWPVRNGHRFSKAQLVAALSTKLDAEIPGQRLLMSQPIQLRFNELLEGTRADVSLKIFGDDQKQLLELAEKVSTALRTVPGAGDVEVEAKGQVPILDIKPRQDVLRKLGVSPQEVLEAVEVALGGAEVGNFIEGFRRFPIIIRLDETLRSDLNTIGRLPVGVGGMATLPLDKLAKSTFRDTYAAYSREQNRRRIAILINPRGRDTESFVRDAQHIVEEKVKLPGGYYFEWGGNYRNLQEARSRLALLGPMTLLLVLLMVFAAFRSWRDTGLIFIGVPFALVGGVLALLIRSMPFSVSAGVGFIALSGIAVLNGVVLVNCFNDLKRSGMEGLAVVREGTLLRLRPVLMTALVDVFGFIPMAVSITAGAEVQRPLATVVIGGILFSTALTLVILPVLYVVSETRLKRGSRAKAI
jgi:cobalt-zinc-cadmium resistance protein CzcA